MDTVSSITGDDYWNSKGDAESYLMGIYTRLRDVSNATLHFEDRGGDAFTTGLEGGPSNLWAQNLTAQNGYSWLDYYAVIHHCNLMIKNVETIPFGIEAEKNAILAETYFIRSMMYFNLVRVWGRCSDRAGAHRELPAKPKPAPVARYRGAAASTR